MQITLWVKVDLGNSRTPDGQSCHQPIEKLHGHFVSARDTHVAEPRYPETAARSEIVSTKHAKEQAHSRFFDRLPCILMKQPTWSTK